MSALDNVIKRQEQYDGRTAGGRDAKAARAELAVLRADVQYWQRTADQERANAAEQRERAEKLRATVEAQARQLEQARAAMLESIGGDVRMGCGCPVCKWLASTAPAPQAQPAQDGERIDRMLDASGWESDKD